MPDKSSSRREVAAALAYPLGFVSGLVCLWRFHHDRFVRFHAWQSIFFSLSVAGAVLLLDLVPLLGLGLIFALTVGAIGVAVFLMWRAYSGRWTALPLIGDLAIERVPPEGEG